MANDWFGHPVGLTMHRLFFEQLGASGVHASACDEPDEMVGVLLGVVSEIEPDLAYVHFHMVDPAWRGRGVGTALYGEFARRTYERGCTRIRALASPTRTGSIAFHESLGFRGTLTPEHLGPDEARIVFERVLPLG